MHICLNFKLHLPCKNGVNFTNATVSLIFQFLISDFISRNQRISNENKNKTFNTSPNVSVNQCKLFVNDKLPAVGNQTYKLVIIYNHGQRLLIHIGLSKHQLYLFWLEMKEHRSARHRYNYLQLHYVMLRCIRLEYILRCIALIDVAHITLHYVTYSIILSSYYNTKGT